MTKHHNHLSDQGWSLTDEEKEFKNSLCDTGDGGHDGGEKERLGDVQRSEGWVEKKGQRKKCQKP